MSDTFTNIVNTVEFPGAQFVNSFILAFCEKVGDWVMEQY